MRRCVVVFVLSSAISACSGQYLGIDRASLDPSAQVWLDRAQAGDKQAQYELGLRFALGQGVPRDCDKARRLIRQAATQSGGTIWVYSPPVTKGGQGRVIPVENGPLRPALPEAQQALRIEGFCEKQAGLGRQKLIEIQRRETTALAGPALATWSP